MFDYVFYTGCIAKSLKIILKPKLLMVQGRFLER
jgi:hypothetical protein